MRHRWMNVVLNLLVNFGKMTKTESDRLRKKYKKGFNVNSQIRDHIGDKDLMYRQAQYIQKAPLSETRIVDYEPLMKIISGFRKTKRVIIKFRRTHIFTNSECCGCEAQEVKLYSYTANLLQRSRCCARDLPLVKK